MTEQQTPDREKKIAEIREGYKSERDDNFTYKKEIVEQDIHFLLSELERKDEVIEEQKRVLFYKSKEITELREKSWQDQQWFKQASANITEMQKELDREREESRKLREERDKLIEGLRKLAKTNAENISEIREWKAKQNDPEVIDLDWYNYVARDILKDIGVTVE